MIGAIIGLGPGQGLSTQSRPVNPHQAPDAAIEAPSVAASSATSGQARIGTTLSVRSSSSRDGVEQ
jgi:hypothetical protein